MLDQQVNGEWTVLARLVRPRGLRGELVAESLASRPEDRFRQIRDVFLLHPGQPSDTGRLCHVESVWNHQGRWIFKFQGIDSVNEAELWRGADVCAPMRERPLLPDGEYYFADLIGCEVYESSGGESLGVVTGWEEPGGPVLLAVRDRANGMEILVPFSRAICREIDVTGKRIVVDLPEGLRDLNRS